MPGTTLISDREASGEFVTLARVVKTQGRWGEVAVEVHSDVPERFVDGMRLFALLASTDRKSPDRKSDAAAKAVRREVKVESLWPHKELLVLKFAGVDSISEAETLIGSELQVPRSERGYLEQGWNYVSDLVGCSVFDSGKEIGRIEDVQFGTGEAPLLVVAGETGKQFDVPFANAYLEGIDTGRRQVRMKLPEGLLNVNAPLTAEEKSAQGRLMQDASGSERGHKRSSIVKNSRRARRPRR
ncbi:MAG TPA: ribosome maturation factor RimM [Candidatus Sulfotelmatobacter sp.]